MPLHIHQQFARVGVREGEFQAAVGQPALALAWVPAFVGYPAGRVRAEDDDGFVGVGAGEDAVAGLLARIELVGGQVDGCLGQQFRVGDAIEGEAAQAGAWRVPGVQVPVVAVVDQPLRLARISHTGAKRCLLRQTAVGF